MSWEAVSEALPKAHGMAWDGCHKMYLAMDEGQVDSFRRMGYEEHPAQLIAFEQPVATDAAFAILSNWWDASCGLRFIQAVESPTPEHVLQHPGDVTGIFTNLIGQFELDEEEPDEFDGDEENGIDKWEDEDGQWRADNVDPEMDER